MGRGASVSSSGVVSLTTLAISVSLLVSLLATAGADAQTQASPNPPPPIAPALPQPRPVTGFVPPFEIMRTVRASGFDPLAPPLREGTTYVVRVTDFRGILMRVVLDARTGAIRDVTRIVAVSDPYGAMSPPYGVPPPYGAHPYGPSAEIEAPAGIGPADRGPPAARPASAPASPRSTTSAHLQSPPLPRPRPAALASQKSDKPQLPAATATSPKPDSKAESKSESKPEPKIGATGIDAGANSSAPAAPGKTLPVPPLND